MAALITAVGSAVAQTTYDPEAAALQSAMLMNPSAAGLRALAASYEQAGKFHEASVCYMQAAEIYRQLGDSGAYRALWRKGSSLAVDTRLFIEDPCGKLPDGISTGAKYEPRYGCYLGAFIANDTNLQTDMLFDDRRCGDEAKLTELIGKPHATYFNYFLIGRPFPKQWLAHLAQIGACPQLAWEGTNKVIGPIYDDTYVREFARDARAANIPIFLRFAYEMNGDWTHYGTPQEYIRNFRIVHDVFEREAPNVAMVWSPNAFPEQNMNDYYPGDRYVDWVGVSMYTVYCRNGKVDQPTDKEDPTDNLKYIYGQYSARKPIMIAEHAATHFCQANNKDVTGWAVDKTRFLYSSLPRLFPRVKMISWYSRNNISQPTAPERQLNNYCLTESPKLLQAYRESVAGDYFLSKVPFQPWDRQAAPAPILEINDERLVSGTLKLSTWVKCPMSRPLVKWLFDGKEIGRSDKAPYEVSFDSKTVANGRYAVKAVAYDSEGKALTRKQTVVKVQN